MDRKEIFAKPIFKISEKELRIAVFPIGVSIEILEKELPETILQEANARFRSEKRREEWLATRYYLRKWYSAKAQIVYHADGAPYIEGSDEVFSLSHSYSFIAFVIGRRGTLGIDVEDISPRVNRVKGSFFSELEMADWQKIGLGDDVLTLMWSAKESIYKAMRTPGLSPQNAIRLICPDTLSEKGRINAYVHGLSLVVSYRFLANSVITYVCRHVF